MLADLLIIENGPTEGNPIRHTAIAVAGQEVYSFGTVGTRFDMDVEDYLMSQIHRRDSSAYLP